MNPIRVVRGHLLLCACLGISIQTGSHDAVKIIKAERVQNRIELDGRLSEDSWSRAAPAGEFRQRDPDEGQRATQKTELRVLYDDEAIYIGARLLDTEPDKIVRRLARRDTYSDADRFTIYLDPHHDHLTGAMFEVSAVNVRRDAIISNDTSEESSWDAVWDSATSISDEGWTVEMRIPFSQLRFPRAERHTWGINAARYIHRNNETDWLELVPKTDNGLASRMAHMTGIDGIEPRGNLEIVPYGVLRPTFIKPSSAQNPFNDGSQLFAATGVDVKYGLSSNFTLNGTINPDFGQVEVDPAVVNLSQFETFFPEKRPFFLEGTQIFQRFGKGGANNFFGFNRAEPDLFYSRRIGRSPQGAASAEFVERPDATTILGAAKVTGKTKSGWSLGFLDAVTGREYAKLADGARRGKVEIEPLTNYFVARAHRDVGKRGGFGFLSTAVHRDLRLPEVRSLMTRNAWVAGADAYVFLDDQHEWVVNGAFSQSRVAGSTAAIERLQLAPQRYFQRPDVPHLRLDPTKTTMRGWAGNLNLNRNSGKYWTANLSVWATSPGFESNDLGLHFRGDAWGSHAVLSLRKFEPDRLSRFRVITFAKFWTWDFANNKTGDGLMMFGHLTLPNYWTINGSSGFFRRTLDPRLTRGGPMAINPGSSFADFGIGTDGRKKLSLNFGVRRSSNESGGWDGGTDLSIEFKPSTSLTLSTGPSYSRSRNTAQYVTAVKDESAQATFGTRYIFSDLDQTSVSMVTRASWVLTPAASLQVFAQPLISTGDYWKIKEFARARTYEFVPTTVDRSAIGDPSFNFKSLRLNAVFRWEWRLGSTLYFVWTQNRVDLSDPGRLSLRRDAADLFRAPADDVFLVKFAYWFGR